MSNQTNCSDETQRRKEGVGMRKETSFHINVNGIDELYELILCIKADIEKVKDFRMIVQQIPANDQSVKIKLKNPNDLSELLAKLVKDLRKLNPLFERNTDYSEKNDAEKMTAKAIEVLELIYKDFREVEAMAVLKITKALLEVDVNS